MAYHDLILTLQPAPNELPLVRAGYLVAIAEAAEIAAQADARIAAINEDAATFRRLLDIAQQVYGFEFIGQAFVEIDRLRRENNTLKATLVTAREEGKL